MNKFYIALILMALNIQAAPGHVLVRNTTKVDIPVLVFIGENCEEERLRSFMDKHRLSPIYNGDPLKAWFSVKWAQLEDTLTPRSKNPLKRQPSNQCRYVGQGFLGATDYRTRDTFAELEYTEIDDIPGYAKHPPLLFLRAKLFKLPYTHTSEGGPYPVKVVFYPQPSIIPEAPSYQKHGYGTKITICSALPEQEIIIEEGKRHVLRCRVV